MLYYGFSQSYESQGTQGALKGVAERSDMAESERLHSEVRKRKGGLLFIDEGVWTRISSPHPLDDQNYPRSLSEMQVRRKGSRKGRNSPQREWWVQKPRGRKGHG